MAKTDGEKHYAALFAALTDGAQDVMGQLFLLGPVWSGNISSKAGRAELIRCGFASLYGGAWAFLTPEGVAVAVNAEVRHWRDQRWYRKQRDL